MPTGVTAPLDPEGFLAAVRTAVDAITVPNLEEVTIGPPESVELSISAAITLGGIRVYDRVNNYRQSEIRIFVIFRREVNAQEERAELDLAKFVKSFILLHVSDRTWGGVVNDSEVNMDMADDPRYQAIAGPEYRAYPIMVIGKQQTMFPVNQP